MDLKRAIKIQSQSIKALQSAYRTARTMGYNQTWLHQEECTIFNRLPMRFPIMRREHLRSVCTILWEEMFERDIEGVYLYKGEPYSINKKSKFHKSTRNIDAKNLHDNNDGFAWFWIETGKMYSPDWSKI